jgi:hypothetical protein
MSAERRAAHNGGTSFSLFTVGEEEFQCSYDTSVGDLPRVLDDVDAELKDVSGTYFPKDYGFWDER